MIKIILSAFLFLCIASSNATALFFTFYGVTSDGSAEGSATMSIEWSDDTLTAILNNTSPLESLTIDPYPIAPGITGFGFDLDPEMLELKSWSLEAVTTDGTSLTGSTTIGDNDASTSPDDWIMNNTIASVSLEYLPTTIGSNMQGALYNPLAVGSSVLSAAPNYFTTATLTMIFDQNIEDLIINSDSVARNNNPSPFVRMQAVGTNEEVNSLKLPGIPTTPPPPGAALPEPSTMFLLGAGLISLAGVRRRQLKK